MQSKNAVPEPNLAVNDIRPFIGAKDFDSSRDFYVALGWKVVYDSESLRVMELGNHRFYLQRYFDKAWCENTMLHVSVEDVDAWYAFAKQRFLEGGLASQARIGGEPKDEGYARVFYIWDPAGVLLHIAEFADAPTTH